MLHGLCVRSTVWEKIEFEDELLPSWEALWHHWLRSCWSQASSNRYDLLAVHDNGWKVGKGCLEIDWDDLRTLTSEGECTSVVEGVWVQEGLQHKKMLLLQSWTEMWSWL